MKNSKKLFLPLIIFLVTVSICTFGYLKFVLGYAYDTAQSKNCAGCHSIRRSKARSGTWAIRKELIREVDSTEGFEYDKWSCDICHTDKRGDFSGTTPLSIFPSSHPVAVKGKERNDLIAGGKKVMYCTNCHDPLQVDRGVHATYVSIFRLKFGGLDSTNLLHYDPDPTDDTVEIGQDSTSWFWSRPFDTTEIIDSSHRAYVKYGKVDHYQSGGVGFNPRNARAGKEKTDFYRNISDSTYQDIDQLRSIYFCVNCHDDNGFPLDPRDTSTSVSDSSVNRVLPYGFVSGPVSYSNSDGDDRYYSQSDGGHVIQDSTGTKTGLKPGDRLPCIDCHDSHSSKLNMRLMRDDITEALGGMNGDYLNRLYCQICHNRNANNPYYDGGIITKYRSPSSTFMMPDEDTARLGGATAGYHNQANVNLSCYSFTELDANSTEIYNLSSGCHKDPHQPTMFCNGCHSDHFQTYGSIARKSHPVGVTLASFPLMPGDVMTIKEYYDQYADTLEVPLFNGGRIECLTCHNDHPTPKDTAYAPQMQGLLRGDAGTNLFYTDLAMVKAGIGNNYKNHDSVQNAALQRICTTGDGMSLTTYNNLRAMPELCLNCHYRIIGIKNNHGGFSGGGFGMCDKCHSMHGQHSEPVDSTASIDSTNLVRPLHYGMYLSFDAIAKEGTYSTGWVNGGYTTAVFEWDTSGTQAVEYVKKVFNDATGQKFSYRQNDHLIHENFQELLCQRCHGNANWKNIMDTTGDTTASPPPQVFYDSGGTMGDNADTYYTASVPKPSNRNKSTHPVDIDSQKMPGNTNPVQGINLRCSSGTKDSGCHSAHGNNNYSQLNSMVKVSSDSSYSIYGEADVLFIGEKNKATYVSGMHEFCSLCHDRFAGFIKDTNNKYTRHPIGPGVSMLNLYDSAERNTVSQGFYDSLIFDYYYDTSGVTGYSSRPTYNQFLNADTAKAANNFLVTCVTCHRQHGSGNKHLRKFSDKAVFECVNCHSSSPDISK